MLNCNEVMEKIPLGVVTNWIGMCKIILNTLRSTLLQSVNFSNFGAGSSPRVSIPECWEDTEKVGVLTPTILLPQLQRNEPMSYRDGKAHFCTPIVDCRFRFSITVHNVHFISITFLNNFRRMVLKNPKNSRHDVLCWRNSLGLCWCKTMTDKLFCGLVFGLGHVVMSSYFIHSDEITMKVLYYQLLM